MNKSYDISSIKDLLFDVPVDFQEYLFEQLELDTKETTDLKIELEKTKTALQELQVKYEAKENEQKMMIQCFKHVIEWNKNLSDHMKKIYSEANSALSSIPPRLVRQTNDEYICHHQNDDIDFDNSFDTFATLQRERAYGVNDQYIYNNDFVDVTKEKEKNEFGEYSLFGESINDSMFKPLYF